MSFDALAWAAKAKGIRPAEKLVLLGLAECASREGGLAFPSIAALIDFSGLNRKTVIGALSTLVERGLIAETGDTVGKTSQIKVYRLIMERVPKKEPLDSPENGTLSAKESQKRDTDTVREPDTSEAKASSDERAREPKLDPFPKPDFAEPHLWADFLTNRKTKKRPNTASAHAKLLREVERWAIETGWPPGDVFRVCVEEGWAGIYDPRTSKNGRGNQIGGRNQADNRDGFARAIDRSLGIDPAERYSTGASGGGGGGPPARIASMR